MIKRIILWPVFLVYLVPILIYANDGPSPPQRMHTSQIAMAMSEHLLDYMHPRVLGVCIWWHCHGLDCGYDVTPELDEYLPDLVISVYNGEGNDPYWEAGHLPTQSLSADTLAHKAGTHLFDTLLHASTGINITGSQTNGNAAMITGAGHWSALRAKSVDVIGSPLSFIYIPYWMLRPDTAALVPYYLSEADAPGRMGTVEMLRPESWNPIGHYIGGGFLHHWGYEFPRSMSVDVDNDYKASVIAALHAADIVTNKNALHVVQGTSNSCGENCVVSNVIEEQSDDHEKWQEVYPSNRHIHPGSEDSSLGSLGNDDANKSKGNYIFVVWRHYRGYVQGDGKLVAKTVDVGTPQKR